MTVEEWSIGLPKNLLLEELMNRYGEELARLAYTYVKDRTRSQDITQDVFIKAFQGFSTFRGQSSYKTWLTRMTINRSYDELKKWRVKYIHYTESLQHLLTSNHSSPESELLEKEEGIVLGKAILSLPLKYREVIVLFYYRDCSLEEISSILDIPVNTVKTRLHRARKKLAPSLGKVEGSEFHAK